MVRRSIDIDVNLDTRRSERNAKDLTREVRDLNEELDDTDISAGDAARAMVEMAGRAERELDDTVAAVDALHRALGEVDRESAVNVVAEFKKLGFTAEQIEADIDAVAMAARAVDDINLKASQQGFDDISHAVTGVDRETRRARDTMTGFAGGMVGELPLVSDALGPVGEGLGQLAEGALEGEINFKQLALAGAGMGAAAIIFDQINGHLEKMKAIDAFNTKQAEEFVDVLRDAESVTDAIVTQAVEAGRVDFMNTWNGEVEDLSASLAAAGLEISDFAEMTTWSRDRMIEWLAAAEIDGSDRNYLWMAWNQQIEQTGEAAEMSAARMEVLGRATREADAAALESSESSNRLAQSIDNVAASVSDSMDAERELREEREEQIETTQELLDLEIERTESQRAAIDSTFALRDAEEEFAKQLDETNEEIADAGDDLGRIRQTMDDAASSAADLADAQLQLARDTANAQGKTLSASQELDVFNRSMLESARVAEGPARDAILEYVAGVNQIPAQKATEISAAIDRGDLDMAERLLNNASRSRQALITAQANVRDAEGSLNYIGRPRTVLFYAKTVGDLPSNPRGPNVAFATGTKGAPPNSFALVGEQGPELVDLPTGSRVRNDQETRRILSGGRGSSGTTIINMPAGVRPMDVAQATRRYERIQGPT